jgi:fructokinase
VGIPALAGLRAEVPTVPEDGSAARASKPRGPAGPYNDRMNEIFGGIEAGGTKFVCAVGTGPDDVRAETRFGTTTPDETIHRAIDFFREAAEEYSLAAIGIASFGPIDPRPGSPTWGFITSTPKNGWAQVDFAGPIREALGVPVAFDTDVNGAALGEHRWGAAQDVETFIYLTIGTGIGGGAMVEGRLLHGLLHPEMGHMTISRRPGDDFPGTCPYHPSCLEGHASGPAIEGRWGTRADLLPPHHRAWELEAHYISEGLANLVCALSPQRLVLGGGVMEQEQLFALLRRKVPERLNGYIEAPEITAQCDDFIVPPGLGNRAGVLGAIALAEQATL